MFLHTVAHTFSNVNALLFLDCKVLYLNRVSLLQLRFIKGFIINLVNLFYLTT